MPLNNIIESFSFRIAEYIVIGNKSELRRLHKILHIFKDHKNFIKSICIIFKQKFPLNMYNNPLFTKNIKNGFYENAKAKTRLKYYINCIRLGYIWYSQEKDSFRQIGRGSKSARNELFIKNLEKISGEKIDVIQKEKILFSYYELKKYKIHDCDDMPEEDKMFKLIRDNLDKNKMLYMVKTINYSVIGITKEIKNLYFVNIVNF